MAKPKSGKGQKHQPPETSIKIKISNLVSIRVQLSPAMWRWIFGVAAPLIASSFLFLFFHIR